MIQIPILHPHEPDIFPPVEHALCDPNGLLAAGGDLTPARLLRGYQLGIFPWFSEGDPILWWSPDPRMVFATNQLHISKRFRRWMRQCDWQLRADTAFESVIKACAEPRRHQPSTWITDTMMAAYGDLHTQGYAHSIEVYQNDQLIGGIYGVAVGRLFFGESMFSYSPNASKVALTGLCHRLHQWGYPLLDAQLSSAHLLSMGGFEMPRPEFCRQVLALTQENGMRGSWREHFPSTMVKELVC